MKKPVFLLIVPMLLLFTVKALPMDAVKIDSFEILKYQVGRCESGNNHKVKPGDDGKAIGKFQFHVPTFEWMKGLAGLPELKITSEQDQEILFKWAIENGYGRHWTCYRDLKKITVAKKPIKVDKYTGAYSIHKELHKELAPVKVDLLAINLR